MKVLVVSDSHGDFSSLQKIYNHEKPLDLLIHLGDGVLEALLLQKKTGIKVEAVNGNNDPRGAFPEELCFNLNNTSIYLCHGHNLNLQASLKPLIRSARQEKAVLALFGHTHQNLLIKKRKLTLLNPGAVCQWEHTSYAILELDDKGFKIKQFHL